MIALKDNLTPFYKKKLLTFTLVASPFIDKNNEFHPLFLYQ